VSGGQETSDDMVLRTTALSEVGREKKGEREFILEWAGAGDQEEC